MSRAAALAAPHLSCHDQTPCVQASRARDPREAFRLLVDIVEMKTDDNVIARIHAGRARAAERAAARKAAEAAI